MVFLMETKLKVGEMNNIRQMCGFSAGLSVDCVGNGKDRAGGITLFWQEDYRVNILFYSVNHILGKCWDVESDSYWFISGIYGFSTEQFKWKTWQIIDTLSAQIDDKWVCLGDFNDILDNCDKTGGNLRTDTQLNIGRQCVNNCELNDLGYEGYPFTWSNGIKEEENIQCRLDRVYGNAAFQNRFSPLKVTHLPRYGSDHAAVLLYLKVPNENKKRRKRIFKFEECWAKDSRCEEEVRRRWRSGSSSCCDKIGALKSLGLEFEDLTAGQTRKEILRVEKLLKDNSMWLGGEEEVERFKDLEKYHAELLKREETIWRQRSRAVWLRDGDKYTMFFHGKASQRRKVNEILKLKDDNGVVWRGEENVERILVHYFADLFTSSEPSEIESTCEVVKDKLSAEH